MIRRVCVLHPVGLWQVVGPQLQQLNGNLKLSLAWPQFPLWFAQPSFHLAWLKTGGAGRMGCLLGRKQGWVPQLVPLPKLPGGGSIAGYPLGNLRAALLQPVPSIRQSLLHCE